MSDDRTAHYWAQVDLQAERALADDLAAALTSVMTSNEPSTFDAAEESLARWQEARGR